MNIHSSIIMEIKYSHKISYQKKIGTKFIPNIPSTGMKKLSHFQL